MKMYKTQKRTSRKRKDVQKASEKNTGKTRKFEGNINMSKRFTIPPEIFGSGVAASTPLKNKDSDEVKNNCGLENFNGLFNKCFNIRRSERLRKRSNQDKRDTIENIPENLKNSSVEIKQPAHSSISENLNDILKLNSYETSNVLNTRNNCNREKRNNKHTWKRSKSIFEEINQLYKTNKYLSKRPTEEFDGKFCSLLYKQINKNFIYGQKSLLVSKSKIFSEIKNIENILLGKVKMVSKPPSKPREYYYDTEENDNDLINWDYFSKSDWVYRTPPAQKIIPPKLDENQMQPAVIYSTKNHTQLFEIKNNQKVNLSDLEGKHNITLNQNTMNHIITTNNTMNMEIDSVVERNTDSQNFCDNAFNFSQPKQDEFMKVFSKPSKSFKLEYREGTKAKRKLDEDLSQDMFSNCKLSDCRQPMNVNTTPNFKKNHVPRNKIAFKLNVPQFESKSNFTRNEFDFMDADQVVGFDFKNIPKSNTVFGFK